MSTPERERARAIQAGRARIEAGLRAVDDRLAQAEAIVARGRAGLARAERALEAGERRLTRAEARLRTRERLLDAAAAVFRRNGYAGATLDDVAEAAGYTKGAVYSNFATKADLFLALLERYVDAESDLQHAQLARTSLRAFIDRLDALFDRQVVEDPAWVVLQIEFWLAAVRDPEIRQRLVAGSERLRARTGAVIDAALAEAGAGPPFTGTELGILLNALGTGLAIQHQLEPGSFDPHLIVRAARRLAGLEPPSESADGTS